MKWIKKGLIFNPNQYTGWMSAHAQAPTVLIRNEYLRIYFSGRPAQGISLPTYIDVDIDDPRKILHVNTTPLLELGKRGSFDEFGIIPCEVLEHQNKVYLYYTGWSRRTTTTYTLAIGLAISLDGGQTFTKAFEGPILDRTKYEPYMVMSPFILQDENLWHMWYGSGIDFHETEGKYEPQYIIKYASSTNGITWIQPNQTCIDPKDIYESNTRPTVIKKDNLYHMWFAYRGASDYRDGINSYRIGYARSTNMIQWQRNDELAGITVSHEGWDSSMITYPYVVEVKNQLIMFYNGNGFGKSGFGYAYADWD